MSALTLVEDVVAGGALGSPSTDEEKHPQGGNRRHHPTGVLVLVPSCVEENIPRSTQASHATHSNVELGFHPLGLERFLKSRFCGRSLSQLQAWPGSLGH